MTIEHDKLIGYWTQDKDNISLCAEVLESFRQTRSFPEGCDFFQQLSVPVKANPLLQLKYSNLLLSLGRYAETEQVLAPIYAQHPSDVYISYNLAYTRYAQKKIHGALEILELVRDKWQSCPEMLELTGRCLRALGDSAAAIPFIKQYLSVVNDDTTLGFLSLLYADCGHNEAAYAIATEVLQTQPKQADALAAATSSAIALNKYHSAESYLNVAVDTYPAVALFWSQRGFVAFATGTPISAAGYYQQALELEPDNTELLYSLAFCKLANNELTEAQAILEQLQQSVPEHADIFAALAIVAILESQPGKATAYIKQALQLDSSGPLSKLAYGLFLAHGGQEEEAFQIIQSVLAESTIQHFIQYFPILNDKKKSKQNTSKGFADAPINELKAIK